MMFNCSKTHLPSIKFLTKPITTTSSSSFSKLINTLLSSDSPHEALYSFKQASTKPLTKTQLSQLYAAIIHITNHFQAYPLSNSLTRQLITTLQSSKSAIDALCSFNGPKSTPQVIDNLIIAFSQLNLVNEATQLLYEMKEMPNVQACNCLLKGVLKSGHFDCAWKVFDEMLKRGVQPNVFTYNILINVCRYEGDIRQGILLMEEMRLRKIKPTVHTYTIIICGLCESGDVREASEYFKMMKGSGVWPNLYTFNALIDGHFKNADVGEALALYKKMIENRLMPNDVSFGIVIDGLCKQGRISDARRLFFGDMATYGVPPTVRIYNCLIDGHSKVGNLEEAFKLFTKMRKVGFAPDAITYGILIKGLCDAKKVGEARELLLKMRKDGIFANSVIYNTIIDGYCKEGNLQKAMETCRQMSEEGLEPNLITFSSLIDGHCKKGEIETAIGMYTEMVAKGFEPDVVTYTTLIDGYSRNRSLDKVFSIEKEMIEKDVPPNVVTNTCLINGLCREGMTRDAINLYLEKTTTLEFKPNSKTYMALIYGMYRAGQYFKAGRFYFYMRESGLVPDVITYSLLMRGQCQMGYVLNAMLLQADMLKIGVMPEEWYISCPYDWSVILDKSIMSKFVQRFGSLNWKQHNGWSGQPNL